MRRALAISLLVLASACAPPARSAHDATNQSEPHTAISPLGAVGLGVLGALLVAFSGVAIFVIPQTKNGG